MASSEYRIRINGSLNRPDHETWKGLIGAPSSTVSDGQGRKGALEPGIRPITNATVFAGPALTVDGRPGDNAAALAAVDWIHPGDVVVLANNGATVAAIAGGHYGAMIKARGAVALVCDGPVRDVEELEELEIPVFARGITPQGPHKTGPGQVGFPIVIGGLGIATGDILVGDRDGVVVVHREDLVLAVSGSASVRAREAEMADEINAGRMPEPLQQRLDEIGIDIV